MTLPDYLAELVPEPTARATYGGPVQERARPYRAVRRCQACGRPFADRIRFCRPARYCPFDRSSRARMRVFRRVRASFVT